MTRLQRYEWMDAIIEAQAVGLAKNGEVLLAAKLARVINWIPKDGGPSALRWSDQEALEVIKASKDAFYTNMPLLIEHGFMVKEGGNYHPTLPESAGDTKEAFTTRMNEIKDKYKAKRDGTSKSGNQTPEYGNQTPKSEIQTRKSEKQTHTLNINHTDDVSTDDSLSEVDAPVVADAPTDTLTTIRWKPGTFPSLPNLENCEVTYFLNTEGVTKVDDPSLTTDSRDAAAFQCGYAGNNHRHHIANHMRLGHARPTDMAKHCPIKEPVSHG